MQRVICPNIVAGKRCDKLFFTLAEGIEFTAVVQSNSKRRKTHIEIKCPKCGELISIRLPRGTCHDEVVKYAKGISPQQQ